MSLVIEERPTPHIALLRLNRSEVRNALSPELRAELRHVFIQLGSDQDTRVIVLTGNNETFSAGADIRAMVDCSPRQMMQRGDDLNWSAIRHCPKPVIAAVNGFALGGGCELAMHADIIVAGEGARFGQPEVKLGIMPGAGGTQRLARAVGLHRAMLLLLTGEAMTAREAFDAGLVSKVTTDQATVERSHCHRRSDCRNASSRGLRNQESHARWIGRASRRRPRAGASCCLHSLRQRRQTGSDAGFPGAAKARLFRNLIKWPVNFHLQGKTDDKFSNRC